MSVWDRWSTTRQKTIQSTSPIQPAHCLALQNRKITAFTVISRTSRSPLSIVGLRHTPIRTIQKETRKKLSLTQQHQLDRGIACTCIEAGNEACYHLRKNKSYLRGNANLHWGLVLNIDRGTIVQDRKSRCFSYQFVEPTVSRSGDQAFRVDPADC